MSASPTAQNYFHFLHDCFEADSSRMIIRSVFQSKYKFRRILSGKEELLEQRLSFAPFDHPDAEKVEKELFTHRLEKSLYYGSIFVLGKHKSGFNPNTNIASPLLLIPIKIKGEEEKIIEFDWSEAQVNTEILQLLDLKREDLGHKGFINELEEIISSDGGVYSIKTLLEKYYLNLDTEALFNWPLLWKSGQIQKELKATKLGDHFKMIPAACYIILDKQSHALGVLNDLEQMAESGNYNNALKKLILGESDSPSSATDSWWRYQLNSEQYHAMQNALRYTNSVIIGPPGTGKSYTISVIAAESISRNQKVLIASKTKTAIEVIRSILEKEYGLERYLVQTSGRGYKNSLKRRIDWFLYGANYREETSFKESDLEFFDQKIRKAEEKYLKELELENQRLYFRENESSGLKEGIQKLWVNHPWRNLERYAANFLQILDLRKKMEDGIRLFSKQKIERTILENKNHHRDAIAKYREALSNDSFTQSQDLMNDLDYEKLLRMFPIWLVDLLELNKILPQEKELFDLLIIDEASQVDMALAMPAIHRAKRVLIVGDPHQLRHYSFLSTEKQKAFGTKYGVAQSIFSDYRNRSILDLYLNKVASQEQVSFLREHFRSSPALIEFSNQEFYNGQLEVLKSSPDHWQESQLQVIECGGTRNKDGSNKEEANAILKQLRALEKEYADEGKKLSPSIGVLSPFSSQVKYLQNAISEKFDRPFLKKHQVLIGGPYHFQGSERDIVLISFALDENSHHSAFIHLNKAEVFNVAISRAISKLMLFHSFKKIPKNDDRLLFRYLDFVQAKPKPSAENTSKDQFANEFLDFIRAEKGFESAHLAHPIAGMVLDLLIKLNGKYHFIDLVGYPGDFEEGFHLERYQTLSRIGISSVPVFYSLWTKDSKAVKKQLATFFQKKVH